METLYAARATANGGRRGHVESPDGVLDPDLAMSEATGGPCGSGTNPERLFAAGYFARFENSLRRVGGQQKENVRVASVAAAVGIGRDGFGLEVEPIAALPNFPLKEAEDLMRAAHQEAIQVYEGTAEIQRAIMVRELTKKAKASAQARANEEVAR